MLENKCFKRIHYSEFIAAWNKHCDNRIIHYPEFLFEVWLKQIKIKDELIPDEIISEIVEFKNQTREMLYRDVKTFTMEYCMMDTKELLAYVNRKRAQV